MKYEDIIKAKINEYKKMLEEINAPNREYLNNKYELENIVGKIKGVLDKIMITDFDIKVIDFVEAKKIVLNAQVFSLSSGIYDKQIEIDLYD